jgi:hypothetical protein
MKTRNAKDFFALMGSSAAMIILFVWINLGISNSKSAEDYQRRLDSENAKEFLQQYDAENYRNRPRY